MTIYEKLNQIQCDLKAPKGQRNSFGNYNYRSCEDILEAVKPLLKLNKVVLTLTDEVLQFNCNQDFRVIELTNNKGIKENNVVGGDRFYIKAIAVLQDCESKDSITTFAYAREAQDKKGMDESQITGASSSYARKYALNGLFLIDDTKDADATNTHGKEVKGKVIDDKPRPITKTCTICKKEHNGPYPKCIECWKKDNAGKVPTATKKVVNTKVAPF